MSTKRNGPALCAGPSRNGTEKESTLLAAVARTNGRLGHVDLDEELPTVRSIEPRPADIEPDLQKRDLARRRNPARR